MAETDRYERMERAAPLPGQMARRLAPREGAPRNGAVASPGAAMMPQDPVEPARMDDRQLREQICRVTQELWLRGLIVGDGGVVTAELSRRRYLATPPAARRASLKPDEVIELDVGGQGVNGLHRGIDEMIWRPHREAYQSGRDPTGPLGVVAATVLATPVALTALLRTVEDEAGLLLAGAMLPIAAIDQPAAIRDAIRTEHAVAITNVGVLTVGRSLAEAANVLEKLEHAAAVELALWKR